MHRQHYLANAVLWASAIVASAILGAPTLVTLVVLPSLATAALVLTYSGRTCTRCPS